MSYEIEFLSEARLELLEAWIWYEERQSRLGDRFKQKVYDCIKLIQQNPKRYRLRRKFYREAIVKSFPYLIVYRIHTRKKIIAIVSVFHTSRNSRKKYRKT